MKMDDFQLCKDDNGVEFVQSLDDYDESNEDEQRQLSYAISGRNNINPQPPVSREVHSSQEPLASLVSCPIQQRLVL